ncbi:MAG TPA: hemagglutinin repeat-containing protein, partial [Cellvibrionaceae bacterium]|nr:hemagglutinin repeat-containing protein [Cellvibrionaceae bacterium]
HGQHTLSATQINNTQGLIYSDAQTLTVTASTVDNTAGRWQHSGQTLIVNGLDEWINKANADTAALLQTDGTLVIQGFNRLLNDGQVGEAPSTIRARSAQLQGKRVENLNGAQLALVVTEKADGNASGIPQALASLPPVKSTLKLDQLVNQGRIFTQASLNLSDANLLNTGGEFSSFSDLTLNAGDLGALGGKLWADGILTLTSTGDFTFANQAQLDAGRGIVWDVKGAFTNQGTLASGTNVTLKANAFTNTAAADLSALGTLALEVAQALTNQGRIRGSSDTQVQANSLENNGLISAQQDLKVTAGASLTNTNTLFATGNLIALAPELFNTSTPTTTASIWAGGKLILAGGQAESGRVPRVGQQLINTSGSIQTYQAGDIELWFNQVVNQAEPFELKPETINVKQWFTTGSGKPADAINDGEFDITISELMGLMDRSGNQLPYIEHNLYVFQPAKVVRQPRINSGGALLIQTLNDPKSAQAECSGTPCKPALIRNEGGSLSAVGNLTLEAGYDPDTVSGTVLGHGSRLDNSNLYLPGETTQESNQFINVIPDPGVAYTDIARFSNMGTFTSGPFFTGTQAVEKAATLHIGTLIAGGELTAHVENVENGEKAIYQAAGTGPAITGDAPPPMDFSQGAPFSRVALSNADSTQVKVTERTQLDPNQASSDGLGSTGDTDITPPSQPQDEQTQAREARIYNPLQNLVLPNNGYLYRVDIKGSSPYVVQAADLLKPPTDTPNTEKPGTPPTSSDYFFSQLGYDPEQIGRRLGDSFYETELVRQAVMETRGVRFVTDPRTGLAIDSDEAQYRYLLDNALEAQKDLQLAVGTALTPEQVRALTQDIVWLERHEMAGQEVWVPVYYATGVDPTQMAKGAVMAGQSVRVVSEELLNRGDIRGLSLVDVSNQKSQNFGAIGSLDRLIVKGQNLDNKGLMLGKTTQVSGFDIDNSGQMIARETLDVTADHELSNRGELAGADVNAKSTGGDVINQGQINASSNVDLDAGRDILLKPGQGAGITTGRNLTAKAARDFNLEGQTINTQGDATLSATRDVTITPTTERSLTSGGNTSTEAVTHTATKITTGGSLSIDAGRDLGITATKIDTGKDLTLRGERDVTLTSAADSTHTEGQGKNWHTIETDVKQVTTNISAGGNIDANAGQDLNLVAVKGKADGDIHLSAKRDTNLLGAVDSEYDYSYEKKKKSLGRSKTKESESLTETAVATELSAGGNLLLNTKLGSKGEILKETGQRINTEGAKLSAGDPEASGETQGTIAAYAADGIILA